MFVLDMINETKNRKMKAVPKKKRFEVYKKAIPAFESRICSPYISGFCRVFTVIMGLSYEEAIYDYLTDLFPELKPYEPEHYSGYWFDRAETRIKILKEIINNQ